MSENNSTNNNNLNNKRKYIAMERSDHLDIEKIEVNFTENLPEAVNILEFLASPQSFKISHDFLNNYFDVSKQIKNMSII